MRISNHSEILQNYHCAASSKEEDEEVSHIADVSDQAKESVPITPDTKEMNEE